MSGGRPAPDAAWAGRQGEQARSLLLEPDSGPLDARLRAPITARRRGRSWLQSTATAQENASVVELKQAKLAFNHRPTSAEPRGDTAILREFSSVECRYAR